MKRPTLIRICILTIAMILGLQSYAQNYVPFTPRFNDDLKGDIVLIGNNILGPDNNAFNDDTVYNHNVNMQYIDIDGDASTFSSSSADLEIPNPNCYQIIHASLYWGAVSPGSEPITEVKLQGPTGGYNDITGTIIFDAAGSSIDGGDSFSYACYADVTDIVTNLGNDLGTYTVANVSSAQGETASFDPFNGTGYSAGWSLFIVYEDPTLPGKSITSFDGFSAISVPGGNPSLDVPVSGFRTVPAPTPVRANFAFATLEGDSPILGDQLLLNGVNLSTVDRPATNFFNSSVTQLDATPVNNRVPNSTNTLGFDTGVIAVPNPGNSVLANNATDAVISLETEGDTYFPYFFAFAVEIIEPNIALTKIVEDDMGNDIGGQTVDLGAPLNYVIGIQNIGNDDTRNLIIRDILPINIIYNHPEDLVLPAGVTVQSYDPVTRELVFEVADYLVEENDPRIEIRIEVQVVDTCAQLADSCANLILNQAFASYQGTLNPNFSISDDPSVASNTGCLLSPQATNFLADLNDCTFSQNEVLCGDSLDLTAANGYVGYSWSTSPTGTPVIGTSQVLTVTETGTYYVFNTAEAPCQSIVEEFVVELFGGDIPNPVIPFADEVVTCPNDGKLLPNIFLCGANDFRDIQTNVAGASEIIWEQLDESSCPAVADEDCANEDDSCTWNEVGTGSDFIADSAGQFRLTINFQGGCFVQFYFNVYQNVLAPDITATDIICTTPGTITVLNVPSGYEYSLDNVNFQASNVFTVTAPGIYTAYIRQVGVPTNPCVFTVPDILVRERDFNVTTNVFQPLCYGDKGSIQLAANDVEPQYFFSLYQGGTLINSVGPITENNYLFENLNPGVYTAYVETEDGCTYNGDITIIEPELLTVTAAITRPLTCDDGEITIYPVGGTPPYFYFINSTTDFQTVPEYVVTAPGVYDITVVDANNCTAETTISVDAIPEPEFTVSSTDISCGTDGGSISINVTNPNGNSIQYSIDGGTNFVNYSEFNGLAAGDYDVVVQYTSGSSVCFTATQTVTIIADSELTGTATLSAPYTCNSGGTITVSGVSGGVPPYSYSIDGVTFQNDPNFTGLTDGTYTITIRDSSGCTVITDEVTVESLDPPTDMEFSSTAVTCPSNTADITITSVTGGVAPLQYQITTPASAATAYQSSNSFLGLEPGTYTFQVIDANECTYSESFTIDPLLALNLNVVLTKDIDCTSNPDAELTGTISGGNPPYTYAVSVNGGAYTDLGTTGTPFSYMTSTFGTYQFEITDSSGCTIESNEITVEDLSLPVLSLVVESQPILCNGDSNGALDITIDTSVGTPPFTVNVNNDTTGTNYGTQTSGLPAGTYTVTLTDSKSCEATETITISEPDAIVVDVSTVDISCSPGGDSQGSVIIDSVTGGTAPYTYYVTGTNGYSNSEVNATGSASVSFNVVDFGLYQINVVDANGCSVLVQDVLVASPPTDLEINVNTTVDCTAGGTAVVSVGSSLSSTGPFFFSIYQGPISVYPNPPGSWIPEDAPGSQSATFTGLTPGLSYTFIVYDASTDCSYYEPATTPIPTDSTLSLTAVTANNITCTGSDDGNVSFTINSSYGVGTNVDYEIFYSLSLLTTGTSGSGNVPANGTLNVTNLGPLPTGNYYVVVTETSGPNSGCGVVTVPFNITESAIALDLSVSIDQNANCNVNSGQISAVGQNGTPPYQYQITTTPASPLATDTNWSSASVFNMDSGTYYVHVLDAFGCVVSSGAEILPEDPSPVISAIATNPCTAEEGEFSIDVTLDSVGIPPYSFSIDGGAFQTQTTPFTISNLSSGVHTIEVQDFNGCGNIVNVDITAPIQLTPEVIAEPSCNDNDGEITVNTNGGSGSFTYSMSPNPASISLSGNVFSGVPAGTYTITVNDTVTSCSEDVEITVPNASLPTISASSTPVICFGDSNGTIEIMVNGYSGAYNYEVLDDTSTSVTGLVSANTSTNPIVVTGFAVGTYTIEVTETDSPFCEASTTVVVTSPADTLDLTVDETSNVTCTDGEGTITATATGGWGSYEYELTGDASVAYSSNGTFTNLSAGTYTINVRDAEGCIDSEPIILELPNPITATFTPSTTTLACFGDANASITISNVSGGQGSNYSYTLNRILPTANTSGPQTSNVFDNLGAGTYTVTINDGLNCELTSLDIVIDEPTQIDAVLVKETTQTCTTQATLTLSATGGSGPYEYSDVSSFATILGTFATSTTFSVAVGNYEYYVRDVNGCIANVSNQITIDPLLPLTLTLDSLNPTINCTGDNSGVIFAEAQGGLGNYVYTLQDTLGNDISATQDSPGVFTELIAGDYVVVVESGDCSIASDIIRITEPLTALETDFNVTNVTCAGDNDGVIEIIASGGTGAILYAISPQLNQFFDDNRFENLEPGDYQVIVQDELGCYEILDITVDEPEQVLLTIVPNSLFEETCAGDGDGEFSIDLSGGTLPYSVSLDNYDGPYTTGLPNQTEFDFTGLGGDDHIVYVRDAAGCESEWNITFPQSVSIEPELLIEFNCDNNTPGNVVTVVVADGIDPADLDYSLNGGTYQESNVFTNVPEGIDQYIEVRHTNGCIQSTEFFTITSVDQLTLTLSEGELNEIIANASGGSGDYQFTLNGEDYGSTNTFIIDETGQYLVVVTDSSGCMAQAMIEMEFVDICIPEYFTPNGDGVNDNWAPGCSVNYPDLNFDIFDRYGRKVGSYRQDQYWDGKYNGKELPTGDYWYVVKLNNPSDREFVGHFTLYR